MLRLVLRDGVRLVMIGFAVGAIALCAFAAALIPLRASRVSPTLALTHE